MFKRRSKVTVIAEGSKISGDISADGLVELNGEMEGNLKCTSLQISKTGRLNGKIVADNVVVNGTVEGPVDGNNIHLQTNARVIGDIHYDTFVVEKGAFFAGRSVQKEETDTAVTTKEPSSTDSLSKEPESNNSTNNVVKASEPNGTTEPKLAWGGVTEAGLDSTTRKDQ
jgi:cytoskeletal protein CcmA (bactofilin family)